MRTEDTHNDGRDDNNNDDYDDVKALLTPKNFDEANAKVLPRRRISRRSIATAHLHLYLRHTGRAPALAMPLAEPH